MTGRKKQHEIVISPKHRQAQVDRDIAFIETVAVEYFADAFHEGNRPTCADFWHDTGREVEASLVFINKYRPAAAAVLLSYVEGLEKLNTTLVNDRIEGRLIAA